MAGTDRFNILIIDPDAKSRSMLKDAALSLPCFKKVLFCSSLEDAIRMGSGFEPVDVATVSYKFTGTEVANFITEIKKTPKGKEWAFISVMKAKHLANEVVAESMLNGLDGFLFEPYSADNLREMAIVTAEVKHKNELERTKGAIELFLNDISKHLDAVAFYASQKKDSTTASNKFKTACGKIQRFKKENWSMYTEVLTDIFSNISPPASTQYRGVSNRVRERMKAKIMKDLENEYNLENQETKPAQEQKL